MPPPRRYLCLECLSDASTPGRCDAHPDLQRVDLADDSVHAELEASAARARRRRERWMALALGVPVAAVPWWVWFQLDAHEPWFDASVKFFAVPAGLLVYGLALAILPRYGPGMRIDPWLERASQRPDDNDWHTMSATGLTGSSDDSVDRRRTKSQTRRERRVRTWVWNALIASVALVELFAAGAVLDMDPEVLLFVGIAIVGAVAYFSAKRRVRY